MRGPFLHVTERSVYILIALGLTAAFAFGQTLAPQPTEQQILASAIGNLFQENARLMVELQKAQAIIAQLQREKAEKPREDAEKK